jgi:hypothetical protein
MACDLDSDKCACPFAFTEISEQVQNYGCLPTPYEIMTMRTKFNKTWACHAEPTSPCVGAINYLKEHNLPYKVVDPILVTELDDWSLYCVDSI